jgi:hypothetical protein
VSHRIDLCPAARQRRTHRGIPAEIDADDASAFPAQLHGEIEHLARNVGRHAAVEAHDERRRVRRARFDLVQHRLEIDAPAHVRRRAGRRAQLDVRHLPGIGGI